MDGWEEEGGERGRIQAGMITLLIADATQVPFLSGMLDMGEIRTVFSAQVKSTRKDGIQIGKERDLESTIRDSKLVPYSNQCRVHPVPRRHVILARPASPLPGLSSCSLSLLGGNSSSAMGRAHSH